MQRSWDVQGWWNVRAGTRTRAWLVAWALGLATAAGASELGAGDDYGATIALRETTPLAELVAHPQRWSERKVLVRGRISDVCQRKGCWTVLSDGATVVRVQFEDYGFFLPKDSVGRQAYAEGRVDVEVWSEREARHYASESRDGDASTIHGPQQTVVFTASGVRILDD